MTAGHVTARRRVEGRVEDGVGGRVEGGAEGGAERGSAGDAAGGEKRPERRRLLMCPPAYYEVTGDNPWAPPGAGTDVDAAMAEWERLRDVYRSLGHEVRVIDPVPGLTQMVYAGNGAVAIDGRAYVARPRNEERAGEGPAYAAWFRDAGHDVRVCSSTAEGEGDFLLTDRFLLAGTGFRTDRDAHFEAQEFFGRPVVSLRLVDPKFYHLDTALCVLDGSDVAYYPAAFSEGSRRVLERLFPDAVIADEDDAGALGLNGLSDGRHVVLPEGAKHLAAELARRGYDPIGVELPELAKGGGGPWCCTMTLYGRP